MSETKTCENCGRPFTIDRPAEAPHKRFCDASCRSQFHYRERKAKIKEAREASPAWQAWLKAKYQ